MNSTCLGLLPGVILSLLLVGAPDASAKLYVVASNPTYAHIVEQVGGSLVRVDYITKGDEDPHFVKPKPSFAVMLSKADAFVATGLDLELWAPALVDKAMNGKIRPGQVGYIAVHDGIKLLEIPSSGNRDSGGVHLFGNPHIYTGPMNAKVIASNIAIGLCKVAPASCEAFKTGATRFSYQIDRRMFGDKLLRLFGATTLTRLAESGKLVSFLRERNFRGQPLVALADGWTKKALPLHGLKLITYHKNWVYFSRTFGLNVIQEVEPKPSIPPSPQSIRRLINTMSKETVKVILAANFYDENKVRMICSRVKARPAIVAFSVHGKPGINSYVQLVDHWLDSLLDGYRQTGVIQ
jgi:ABC-type Zn uptake system ZnuABC Zn-binding protein ZnuA